MIIIKSLLDALSKGLYQNFVLLDVENDRFKYVSDGILNFCGLDESVLLSSSAKSVLYNHRFEMESIKLISVVKSITRLLADVPQLSLEDMLISLDLNIKDKNSRTHIFNHKYIPLKVSQDGKSLLQVLILISLPTSHSALSKIVVSDNKHKILYVLMDNNWSKCRQVRLSTMELRILELAAIGKSRKEMALILHRSEDAVKSASKTLRQKLGVKNMTEAILAATHFQFL